MLPRTLLAGALLVVAAVPAAAAQRATLERITHRDTLENGLRVIVVENHAVPLATVAVAVRTGAMSQPPEDQGVPHLFEHMLFKSYRGPDDETFGQVASDLIGTFNGETTEEVVDYYLMLPSSKAKDAIDLMAHLVRDPVFENRDLQKERFVVFGELERDVSDPRTGLGLAVSQRLWGAKWNRKNTLGQTLPLMGVNVKHLQQIYDEYYIPNNAALIVTGDVSPAEVLAAARHSFGGWKRRADPYVAHPVPPMPPLDSNQAVVVTGNVKDVTLEIAWQGPSVGSDPQDTYAADVVSDLVDDGNSAFHKHLVDSGLFTQAALSYETLNHVGPITLYATTTPAHLAAALTALQLELMRMGNADYYDTTSIAVAKQRRIVDSAFQLEEGATLATGLSYWWAVTGMDYYLGYVTHLQQQTPADLSRYVSRYMAGKPFVVGVLVQPSMARSVSEMLAEYLEMAEGR
jgi:zinc protease